MPRPVYATIADLRELLPDVTVYSDDRIVYLLELGSDLAESLTGQVFAPIHKTVTVGGWGQTLARHPNRWKIAELEAVNAYCDDTQKRTVPPHLYVVGDRYVRLKTIDKRSDPFIRAIYALPTRAFPYDDLNVELAAVWGDFELGDKLTLELTQQLNRGDTTIQLNDTSDLYKNDVLTIGDRWLIVNNVDSPVQVTVDPSPFKAAVGSVVERYGSIWRMIREAVLRTAVARAALPGSEEEIEAELRRRLKREETDNYEIEFFQAKVPSSDGAGIWTGTGDPVADALLSKFTASAVSAEWV